MAQQAKVQEVGQHKFEELALNFLMSTIVLVLTVITGGITITLFGNSPFQAYGTLMKEALGMSVAFIQSLTKSMPLLLTGLAVALTYKCTVFNIGAEGQSPVGVITAGIMGHILHLPAILNIPIVLVAPMLAGMVWVFFLAVLKQRADVNVVISTIVFNYAGQYLVQYLISGPFKGEGAAPVTKTTAGTARPPKLLPSPFALNLGVVIALVAAVPVYILLNRTSLGYEMYAVGLNKNAAYANGINVERNVFLALLMSDALAGLTDGIGVTGTMGKVINSFSASHGLNGILVALMTCNNPFTIIITAFLVGNMYSGSLMMQSSVDVSRNMVDIIQGLVIVFLCAENVIYYCVKKRRGGK